MEPGILRAGIAEPPDVSEPAESAGRAGDASLLFQGALEEWKDEEIQALFDGICPAANASGPAWRQNVIIESPGSTDLG